MADVEWDSEAVAYMWERHGVTPDEAEAAIDDPDALPRSPDPGAVPVSRTVTSVGAALAASCWSSSS
ncbi:BrnT family toxin [Rathayibacter soli]|uniref:hypothetical protein n=1 Tax=Rathayibacter soli TaxID=3144168 RepID=UPI0027E417C5|nr:hypothetical protein [Glaciibacter superstes]